MQSFLNRSVKVELTWHKYFGYSFCSVGVASSRTNHKRECKHLWLLHDLNRCVVYSGKREPAIVQYCRLETIYISQSVNRLVFLIYTNYHCVTKPRKTDHSLSFLPHHFPHCLIIFYELEFLHQYMGNDSLFPSQSTTSLRNLECLRFKRSMSFNWKTLC